MKTDWKDLCNTAKQQLHATSHLVPHSGMSFITLLHEPSFDNHSFLKVTWKSDVFTWHRSIWDRVADSVKFTPIGNLPYIGKEIIPTIVQTAGSGDIQSMQAIINTIANLSIRPRINPLNRFTLDGSHYTLTIGVDDLHTTYYWHTSPDEWQDLEDLADQLLRFQEGLR